MAGRKPLRERAMTNAERQARFRAAERPCRVSSPRLVERSMRISSHCALLLASPRLTVACPGAAAGRSAKPSRPTFQAPRGWMASRPPDRGCASPTSADGQSPWSHPSVAPHGTRAASASSRCESSSNFVCKSAVSKARRTPSNMSTRACPSHGVSSPPATRSSTPTAIRGKSAADMTGGSSNGVRRSFASGGSSCFWGFPLRIGREKPRPRARKRAKLIRVKFCRELVRLSL